MSILVNNRVDITTPTVSYTTLEELSAQCEAPVVFIYISYKTGLQGKNLLILKERDVKVITDLMMGGDGTNVDDTELSDLHLSAICEAMNQMMGSAATSMSSMINEKVDISPPTATRVDFGDNNSENGTNKKSPDQLMGIDFAENVSVNAVSGDKADVVSVQEAYDILTRENKSQVSYIIKEGDTLEQIAKDYQMTLDDLLKLNDIASQNVVVVPGDELVVTVPDTQITVLTTKQLSYDEDYKAEVSYIDDNNNSRGTNTILDEGTSGKRTVVANVTYANGREVARDIVKENITEESKPGKIAVGTLTQTDYIKPVAGTFVSGYGTGEDTVNYGVDWTCSEGITVVAARAGKVTRAGWYGGYGYCVDIQHEDGSLTRYANNSRLTVSVGEQVSQGQQIALSGSTGDVTSPRLHFEIWIDGTRVNPLNYVNKN